MTSISNLLGVCSKCGTSQRLDKCEDVTMAKTDVEADRVLRSYSAFPPILEESCSGNVSKETLLTCEFFSLLYTKRNVISVNKSLVPFMLPAFINHCNTLAALMVIDNCCSLHVTRFGNS